MSSASRRWRRNAPSPEGGVTPVSLSLFLLTLVRNQKWQEFFKISNLCKVIVKVGAYKSKFCLTQSYNCQSFGSIWSTALSLLAACVAEVVTTPENVRRRGTPRVSQTAATASWKMGSHPIQPTTGAVVMKRRNCSGGRTNAWQRRDCQEEFSSPNIQSPSGRSPLFCVAPWKPSTFR